jgi:hypothetical protein
MKYPLWNLKDDSQPAKKHARRDQAIGISAGKLHKIISRAIITKECWTGGNQYGLSAGLLKLKWMK